MNILDWLLPGSWTNGSGTMGFVPDKNVMKRFPELNLFVTNPISYLPRDPAKGYRIIDYPGGFLVHTGWPNPGFHMCIKKYAEIWERSKLAIMVHLLAENPSETYKMVRQVETLDNIFAIEISVSSHMDFQVVVENMAAALGELPVIMNVPIDRINAEWIPIAMEKGIQAISLQPPRGVIIRNNVRVNGRMFGRAAFPITLNAISEAEKWQIPVLAGVGLVDLGQANQLLDCGAYAIQLYELLWRGR